MNINRFLSRRDKNGSSHRREKSQDKSGLKNSLSRSFVLPSAAFSNPIGKSKALRQTSYSTVYATTADSRPGFNLQSKSSSGDRLSWIFKNDRGKKDDELEDLVTKMKLRIQKLGYSDVQDEEVNWALSSKHANRNVDKAFDYLLLFRGSTEGKIVRYDPEVNMLGAENLGGVTCYIDSVLFAMFNRGSLEHLLCQPFDDEPTKRLATLMRFWVNMLRSGYLIHTDITAELQEALAACGWDNRRDQQQDASELYVFITDKIRLPLLTLKVDIYHHGAEDTTDDHKIVHERMLEVAVPEQNSPGEVTNLEDCLETFINNKIEVRRPLERCDSKGSIWSTDSETKGGAHHIETLEIERCGSQSPRLDGRPTSPHPVTLGLRHRTTSIIRHRMVRSDEMISMTSDKAEGEEKVRKEVAMPAWQFFTIVAGQSDDILTSNAAVAAHLIQKKPVLAICLKRYSLTESGEPVKNSTYIDIPLDLGLPHFIQDGDAQMANNFKLSLQSVICHQGSSLNSGHYVSYCRRRSLATGSGDASHQPTDDAGQPPDYAEDNWVKFDDIEESERVKVVKVADVKAALKDAYLLSYQIIPLFDDTESESSDGLPPSYDSGIYMDVPHGSTSSDCEEQLLLPTDTSGLKGYFDGAIDVEATPKKHISDDIEGPRRSLNILERRRDSLTRTDLTDASTASSLHATEAASAPVTPNEVTTAQRISRVAARIKKSGNKSRPTSAVIESRPSGSFSRLTPMKSKDQLNKADLPKDTVFDGGKEGDQFQVRKSSDSGLVIKNENILKTHGSKRKKQKDKIKSTLEKDIKNGKKVISNPNGFTKMWPNPERQCNVM